MILALSYILLSALLFPFASAEQVPINPPAPFPEMLSAAKDDNIHQSPQKFKKYVKDKYKQISHAESDVKQTSHGLSGRVFILGNIVPQKKPEIDLSKKPDKHIRARAIAKAFMEDEAALLGITNFEELRESNIGTDNGFGGEYTHINYKRYINNINLGDVLQLTIGPDEYITGIMASLVAIPTEVYEATKKKTISEEEVKSIIEADLEKEYFKRDYKNNKYVKIFNKLVVTKPPYVLWDAFYFYYYEIDAFTGEILSKENPIKKWPIPSAPKKGNQENVLPPISDPLLPHK